MRYLKLVVLSAAFVSTVVLADTIKETRNSDGTTTFDHGSGVKEHVRSENARDVRENYREKGHKVERQGQERSNRGVASTSK